jgi:hypothetical protein
LGWGAKNQNQLGLKVFEDSSSKLNEEEMSKLIINYYYLSIKKTLTDASRDGIVSRVFLLCVIWPSIRERERERERER